MKGFLRDPLFWVRDTLRRHWREMILITATVWIALAVVLAAVSA